MLNVVLLTLNKYTSLHGYHGNPISVLPPQIALDFIINIQKMHALPALFSSLNNPLRKGLLSSKMFQYISVAVVHSLVHVDGML